MNNYKTVNVGDGDVIDLQADLSPSNVVGLSPNVLGILYDPDAEQTTYERRIKRDKNPTHADIEVPEGAIVVDLQHDLVDLLIKVES